MNTVRCPLCKRMYQFSGMPPKCCPECYFKEEAQYQVVRDLVRQRPGINVITVSEMTGVPHAKILSYLREERLEALPTSTVFLKCASCGKMINSGTYCPDCKRRFGEESPAVKPGEAENSVKLDARLYNVENVIDERINKNTKR